MAEDVYTLKEMLTEMRVDMQEHNNRLIRMEETLLAVLEQAKKTNGRVSKSEVDIQDMKTDLNRWKVVGATVVSIAGIVWTGVTFVLK